MRLTKIINHVAAVRSQLN